MAPRILYDVVLGDNVLRGVENDLVSCIPLADLTGLWLYDGMTITDNGIRIYLMRVEFYPRIAELKSLEIRFVIFTKQQGIIENLNFIMRRKSMKKLTQFQKKLARWLDGLPLAVFRLFQLSILTALLVGIFFARPFDEQGLNIGRVAICSLSLLYFIFSFKMYLNFVQWKREINRRSKTEED